MDQIDYSQPDFYRFSEDSLHLARFVIEHLAHKKINHLIDVCAGSGVIGIEIANSLENISFLSFVEYQDDFLSHLQWNLKNILKKDIPYQIIPKALSKAEVQVADLIVANPPYFDLSKGRISPDSKKATSRHFIQDSKEDFFKFLERNLSPEGITFFIAPFEWEGDVLERGGKIAKKLRQVQIYSWSFSVLKR